MKILTIFDLNLGLGMAHDTFLFKMCHALASRGHKVHFLVGSGDALRDPWLYYGVRHDDRLHIHRIPRVHRLRVPLIGLRVSLTRVFNFFCGRTARKIYSAGGLDVVYLSGLKPAELFLTLRKKVPVPYLYEVHQIYTLDYPGLDLFNLEMRVLGNAEKIIATTEALKNKLIEVFGISPDRISVVHLAADACDEDSGSADSQGVFTTHNLCYVGQLYRLQGVENAIESLRSLPGHIRLHIIGGTPKHIAVLSSHAKKLELEERVVFHGFVPPGEVRKQVRDLSPILLMPSLAEERMDYVAHTKLYEYLSYGLPVVASDLSSVREADPEGEAIFFVEPGSPAALAAGVRRLLGDPRASAGRCAAAKTLSLNYTWGRRSDLFAGFAKAVAEDTVERRKK